MKGAHTNTRGRMLRSVREWQRMCALIFKVWTGMGKWVWCVAPGQLQECQVTPCKGWTHMWHCRVVSGSVLLSSLESGHVMLRWCSYQDERRPRPVRDESLNVAKAHGKQSRDYGKHHRLDIQIIPVSFPPWWRCQRW